LKIVSKGRGDALVQQGQAKGVMGRGNAVAD
jgi:hypothetical protein